MFASARTRLCGIEMGNEVLEAKRRNAKSPATRLGELVSRTAGIFPACRLEGGDPNLEPGGLALSQGSAATVRGAVFIFGGCSFCKLRRRLT